MEHPPALDSDGRSNLLAFVFTDLAASTALKTRMGDLPASGLLARHQAHVRRLIVETSGREIDQAGDGFFLAFDAPSAAVTLGLRLQEIHHSEPDLPAVRVGIHLGEVTERPAPAGASKPTLVEGLAVDLAARIQSLAQPGQILMSAPVFDAARQRLKGQDLERDVAWRAHGLYRFQGIDQPVEIGEAGFEGISPLSAPSDSEKARRSVSPDDELTLGWRPAVGLGIPGRPHWELEAQLGTGAIGEVWLASHEKTHAKRVFKFCFQADHLRTLQREVILLRLLKENLGERHDIAQVIDWEFERPPYFLEMEHTESGDLVEWARRQGGIDKVSLETRLEIVAQAADALAAAHGAGVLHKDLKPANILIAEEDSGRPQVRLTDFGIGLVTSRQALEVSGVTVAGLTEELLSSGASTGAGTRLYMAPEVIEGREPTPRADLYSLGVVLYQMAAGDLSRALAPGWERDVPDELLRADISACVDREVERRLVSADTLAVRLRTLGERRAAVRARRRRRVAALGSAAALVVILVGLFAVRTFQQSARVRWARETAIPEITRLIESGDYAPAFALAEEAERYLGADPLFEPLWAQIAHPISIETEPSGATISYRAYADWAGDWTSLGPSPLEARRVPIGPLRWKIELEGYEPRELAFHAPSPWLPELFTRQALRFSLDLEGSVPDGMVAVDGGDYKLVPLGAVPATFPLSLERFLIDRTEVTNAEYKAFVDAGGYERRELWKEPFVRDGATLTWEEAMAHFRDSTGRPGPATWIVGEYAEGEAEHPVRGVSWYEAAAYAEFRGKSLPTLYHWALAALPDSEREASLSPAIISQSNIGGPGPAPVGSHPGISYAGAYDMAGNVYEWVWNAERERRYLLGGAWSDPGYTFTDLAAESPWRRLPKYGFRCALYTGGEPPEALRAALDLPEPDFYGAPEVPDEVAEAIKQFASYDRTPLNARVEGTIEHPWAREERVTVDAAYGGERLTLFLYLPSRYEAPYQTVVWFPGGSALVESDTTRWTGYNAGMLRFFLKSGRAVVLPIYAGMLERNDGRIRERLANPNSLRELLFQWRKDLGRTLDYLEEREDLDGDRVAYAGLSLGATVGPIMLMHEDRFRAAMLWSGGFPRVSTPEGVQSLVDAAKRTEVPVLMLNGRYDFSIRVETLQVPMFELLGTPPEHKRHVIYDAGHWPFPRSEFVKDNLDWLDRYLGPVEPPSG